jgi:hypothetical protein
MTGLPAPDKNHLPARRHRGDILDTVTVEICGDNGERARWDLDLRLRLEARGWDVITNREGGQIRPIGLRTRHHHVAHRRGL